MRDPHARDLRGKATAGDDHPHWHPSAGQVEFTLAAGNPCVPYILLFAECWPKTMRRLPFPDLSGPGDATAPDTEKERR